jgi:NAD(P)-dependent dehydrogenase (short-subunit alcohol dehydrogenase family)
MSTAPHSDPSLAGRTIVVTGASDGIGKAAVRALVERGALVTLVGRNEAKTAAAARSIMSASGRRTVQWEIADLSQQEQVRALAGRLRAAHPQIHLLANNAGAMFLERSCTVDGLERTFALNHLSYFTLTLLLLPSLLAAARPAQPARVINVSSRAHRNATPNLGDLQGEQRFGGWRAYANSKLFNLWFTRALARRLDPQRVVVQAMHPGVVRTRFATNNGRRGRLLRRLMDLTAVTPEQGADTLVWLAAATEPDARPGRYWVRRHETTPSALARDDAQAQQLWALSAALAQFDADQLIRDAQGVHAGH